MADFWTDAFEKFGVMVVGLAAFAVIVGVLLFFADRAPKKGRDFWQLLAFVAPAMLLLLVGLIYPAIRTTYLAFTDRSGNEFVGLRNFEWMFTQPEIITVLLNTVVWVIVVPLLSTIFGLAYAVFIDKAHGEKILKSLVFLPMAISFVGASIIWRFVYEYREQGFGEQIGILNQIIVWVGGEPQQFLQNSPWNTFFLIVVMVWIQTGFAMVLLSAAIKGVPVEIVEAARLDGANAWQQFRNVTLPGIRGTLVVVITTISIATLKVFDIVRSMTAGQFGTSVVANEMYTQAFRRAEIGQGSVLALTLFIMVLPIVIYNVRVMRQQKEIR
ncbi:carbohydrate ABC transporter membrane protein 1 (CUT1 family) [Microcella putealis]|uniref:Carbohydrate ABC transporter membrane protein 1 (CUT1 family) n=1 Tax=Microcella putealis TaxID=337005 RepID=A0A4V2EW85_9MICO|nr:sugar ABC transporter permease [Microcella putealis]RZS55110.1 carbohydrate ABC transporter membrane protein 1 (CUT1 family) [Microcella putealis]TQM19646.1 carbohydrate ABC transporter membrane protein 1 (CUT1 family) [Microcella putealis]